MKLSSICLSGILAHLVARDIVSVLKNGDTSLKNCFYLNGEVVHLGMILTHDKALLVGMQRIHEALAFSKGHHSFLGPLKQNLVLKELLGNMSYQLNML